MAHPIIQSLMEVAVFIENAAGKTGTGFFVVRNVAPSHQKIYLVTNKHVVHPDPAFRASTKKLTLHTNLKNESGALTKQDFEIPMIVTPKGRNWFEHPDSDVDILAIDITFLKVNNPSMVLKGFRYDTDIASKSSLETHEIGPGDDALMVGYPLGIHQGTNHSPSLRSRRTRLDLGTTRSWLVTLWVFIRARTTHRFCARQ